MKLYFSILVGLAFWQAPLSHAALEDELKKYAISSLYPERDEYNSKERYFVIWRGKPTAFEIHVQAGFNRPSDIYGYGGSVQSDIAGIKVRVRAFDDKGREAGQINGPGKGDDTFLTGQKCQFTPPKPGFYRLTLEVLAADGQVIPVSAGLRDKSNLNSMNLLVHRPPAPQMEIAYSAWQETPDTSDLYERKISVVWRNSHAFIPKGYSYRSKRRDGPKWVDVTLRVELPLRLKNLDQKTLSRICWLSATTARLKWPQYFPLEAATQYFRYDPTRDTPRNLDFYAVTARITAQVTSREKP